VLVTGVNGFIGSHVTDQFLQYGYKVRGTVRDTVKNAWLSTYFDKNYGPGTFELVSVPDMTAEGAYDEVIKGTIPSLVPLRISSRADFYLLRSLGHRSRCIRHDLRPRPEQGHPHLRRRRRQCPEGSLCRA
jgi:hypothetical protein